MKKLVISLIVASAALFGFGSVTSAQYGSASTSSAGLPATGSDGIGTTTGIAVGLLAVGLGLFIVTRVRRRQSDAVA